MSDDLRSAALEYGNQGIAIMPCAERGKKPALDRTGKEHAVATNDTDQILQWWTKNPQSNIGIVCTANALAVIDIDGEVGVEWIRDNQLPMPATWTTTTARGFHYYYRWPTDLRIRTSQIASKLEIRAAGAYVIAPPSVHPNGDTYQWNPNRCDWDALPELPPKWIALQPTQRDNVIYLERETATPGNNTVALKRLNGFARHLAETPKGGRHQALYTIARTLGGLVASRHLTHDDIHTALFAAAEVNGLLTEDGDRNVAQTIADGIAKGIDDGPDPGHHETGERNPYTLTPPKADIGRTEPDDGIHEVDILALMTEDFDDAKWLIEPIVPALSAVALYAAGKTGKSLLALDLVAAAASGRPILGGDPLEAPIHILYVDQEMMRRNFRERLDKLGYTGSTLITLAKHLHYYQLKPWPFLDTEAGGQRLLAEAEEVGAKLVVIDTLIRTVSGEENSADTIKDFNHYTGTPLKAAGIALLRIDHAGKDLTRGQRGTSAKRDDVDVVWLLKPATGSLPGKEMFTLVCEASRDDWVQEDIHITRNEGPPLAHTIPTSFPQLTATDIAIVNYLQEQGLWRHNVNNPNAREALNDSPLSAKNNRLAHVVKWMKRYGDCPSKPGESGGESKKPPEGESGGESGTEKGKALVGEGESQRKATEKEKLGKGNLSPPPREGRFPPLDSDEEEGPIPW